MIKDANSNAYVARILECSGPLPDALNYFLGGSPIQLVTPKGKQRLNFKTKYPFLAVSFNQLVFNAKQSTVGEGSNDQGISLSLNAFLAPAKRRLIPMTARSFQRWIFALGP